MANNHKVRGSSPCGTISERIVAAFYARVAALLRETVFEAGATAFRLRRHCCQARFHLSKWEIRRSYSPGHNSSSASIEVNFVVGRAVSNALDRVRLPAVQ